MGAFNLWRTGSSPVIIPSHVEEVYIPFNPQNVTVAFPPLAVKQVTSGLRPTFYKLRNNDDDGLTVTWDVPQDVDDTKLAKVFFTYIPEAAGEIDFIIRVRGFETGDPVGAGESNIKFNFSHTPTGANEWQSRVDLTGASQQILLNPIESVVFQIIRDGVADANNGDIFPVSMVIQYFTIGQTIQP